VEQKAGYDTQQARPTQLGFVGISDIFSCAVMSIGESQRIRTFISCAGIIPPKEYILGLLRDIQTFYETVPPDQISRYNAMVEQDSHSPKKEPRGRHPRAGYVYLVRSGLYHKIGISTSPEARIKSISSPYPVELIHSIETDDMFDLESLMHERFASKRPEDVEYIKGL
jgi:hypothetical protein